MERYYLQINRGDPDMPNSFQAGDGIIMALIRTGKK